MTPWNAQDTRKLMWWVTSNNPALRRHALRLLSDWARKTLADVPPFWEFALKRWPPEFIEGYATQGVPHPTWLLDEDIGEQSAEDLAGVMETYAHPKADEWHYAALLLRSCLRSLNAGQANTFHCAFIARLLARPTMARDEARQAGTQKSRGSRMPELDAHIAACLAANPKATAGAIWRSVPDARDDYERAGVYRDGENVVECHNERERDVGRSGFEKRVTKIRKARHPR